MLGFNMSNNIDSWNPEDEAFWERQGRRIAYRNLLISIPCLMCAFAVWLYWSIITVQMKNLHYPFDTAQLFSLTAIAGFVGATLRIPNAFMISLCGGRNAIFMTTALLLVPAIGTGMALRDHGTPYSTYVVLACLSGIGGGAFASSMSNISFFFPKKISGSVLGLNAGLGNLGLSAMQVLLPLVMGMASFWPWGTSVEPSASQTVTDGTTVHIENCGFVWVPILAILAIAALFGMNNLAKASPNLGSTVVSMGKVLPLLTVGFVSSGIGLYLLLALTVSKWIVLPLTLVLTLVLMNAAPEKDRVNLRNQYRIFGRKHNWIMTLLYTMTFGSFIGYTVAFPLLIRLVFGNLPDGTPNPNAPNPFVYAWLGPLVGSLARTVGGWLADRFGGAKITQLDTIVMILATLGVAYFVKLAGGSNTPENYFIPFLLLFLILFIATGIGNGSTFRMIPVIFDSSQAGPVLGWVSAVAAYGAFIIPIVFGEQITSGNTEYALYSFSLYYVTCLALNWYYYARKGAEISC